ncbi:MAG: superoxide dismutase family protein [Thermoanaerobaculia bacterium]
MRNLDIVLAFGLSTLVLGCASSPGSDSGAAAHSARTTLEARSGSALAGTATFTETKGGGVHVVIDVTGAAPGTHAAHLHEKGDCSAPDAASAGGHFNPGTTPHGAPDASQHHAGDFGNMTVGADGKGHIEVDTTLLTVSPGPNSVLDRAVIVHAKEDDMKTQPSGNAGGRIGCGVVH